MLTQWNKRKEDVRGEGESGEDRERKGSIEEKIIEPEGRDGEESEDRKKMGMGKGRGEIVRSTITHYGTLFFDLQRDDSVL